MAAVSQELLAAVATAIAHESVRIEDALQASLREAQDSALEVVRLDLALIEQRLAAAEAELAELRKEQPVKLTLVG